MSERMAGIPLNTLGEREGFLISRTISGATVNDLMSHDGPQKFRAMHVRVNRTLTRIGIPKITREGFSREVALLFAAGLVKEEPE